MSYESESWRKRAMEQREAAERSTLPMVRARGLAAAEALDAMAARFELADQRRQKPDN